MFLAFFGICVFLVILLLIDFSAGLLSAALLPIVVVACRADLSERCARLRLHSQTVLEDVFSDAPGVRASTTCTKRTYVCVVTADNQRPLHARELEL